MKSYKIVLIGDASVGKTSIVSRLIKKRFVEHSCATIGANFVSYMVDKKIRLNIWDTAGQERYRSMVSMYYRNTDYCLIVFDINNYAIDDIEYWIDQYVDINQDNNFVLVGNKDDLASTSTINEIPEDIMGLMDKHGVNFFSTSAVSGHGIEEVFEYAAEMVPLHRERNKERGIIIDDELTTNDGNVCIGIKNCSN